MSTASFWLPSPVILPEGDLPMTMQIAMVAKDGIVLASDTMISTSWLTRRSHGAIREEHAGPKILISEAGTMAVSCAIDMNRANEVANKIISEYRPEDSDLQGRILGQLVKGFYGGPSFECIVACLLPIPHLLRVSYIAVEKEDDMRMNVTPCGDRLCAGDQASPAKFWHLRYYNASRPVEELIPLAAQLIVDAAYFNSGCVGGLYVVTTRRHRFESLSEGECALLMSEARERSRTIENLIFIPSGKGGGI